LVVGSALAWVEGGPPDLSDVSPSSVGEPAEITCSATPEGTCANQLREGPPLRENRT